MDVVEINKEGITNWFFGGTKNINEKLATLAGIVTSLLYFYTRVKPVAELGEDEFALLLDALNAGVLLLFLVVIKNREIEEADKVKVFKPLEKILTKDAATIQHNALRVNHSIGQFVTALRGFLYILMLFYVAQFFMDLTMKQTHLESTNSILRNHHYFSELLGGNQDYNAESIRMLLIDFINNTLNVGSSAFLLVAFQVLYGDTIRPNNTPSRRHYLLPLAMAGAIIVLNVVFVLHGVADLNLYNIKRIIGVLCGLYAAVSMLLLFSRFVSMEHFFDKAEEWVKWFYQTGIIASLPFYAVVQVLYGLFDDPSTGDAEIFRSVVFLVCLWGKLVFLMFVYTIIKSRWIHAYLLMVVCHQDTMRQVSLILPSVKDFDKQDAASAISSIKEPI